MKVICSLALIGLLISLATPSKADFEFAGVSWRGEGSGDGIGVSAADKSCTAKSESTNNGNISWEKVDADEISVFGECVYEWQGINPPRSDRPYYISVDKNYIVTASVEKLWDDWPNSWYEGWGSAYAGGLSVSRSEVGAESLYGPRLPSRDFLVVDSTTFKIGVSLAASTYVDSEESGFRMEGKARLSCNVTTESRFPGLD